MHVPTQNAQENDRSATPHSILRWLTSNWDQSQTCVKVTREDAMERLYLIGTALQSRNFREVEKLTNEPPVTSIPPDVPHSISCWWEHSALYLVTKNFADIYPFLNYCVSDHKETSLKDLSKWTNAMLGNMLSMPFLRMAHTERYYVVDARLACGEEPKRYPHVGPGR